MHARWDPGDVALRCLIVDDNPGFIEAARTLLEREGVAIVAVASTSAEALERAREVRPDVALVDIDLGDESGLELARQLVRADLERLRVVLISTYPEADFADVVAASPAVGFVAKPTLSARAIHEVLREGASGRPGR